MFESIKELGSGVEIIHSLYKQQKDLKGKPNEKQFDNVTNDFGIMARCLEQ